MQPSRRMGADNQRKVVESMQVRSEQEALFVACQMESTAVQLYSRALQVMQQLGREREPLYREIEQMLHDEEGHLRHFSALYQGLDEAQERELTLSAVAEGLLFEGGLMGAARQGLLKDTKSMLELAAKSEKASAQKYRDFAAQAQTEEARDALLMIAQQEDGHLIELETAAERGQL